MTTLANRMTLMTAAITAAVLIGVGSLVVGDTPGPTGPRTTGETTPLASPPAGVGSAGQDLGPEGVPNVSAEALGPASSPAKGGSRGGVPCVSGEQFSYHVHARLTLFVKGEPRAVPLGVGIGKPVKVSGTGSDRFASSGSCFSFLHTHADDGVIHIEAPGPIDFHLRQFFAVWDQRLDPSHLGRYKGRVVAFVNGRRYRGDPREIRLKRHAQIQLEVGQPIRAPAKIKFPSGF
jgi:hypothetical protein